jgi:hypothetical protein
LFINSLYEINFMTPAHKYYFVSNKLAEKVRVWFEFELLKGVSFVVIIRLVVTYKQHSFCVSRYLFFICIDSIIINYWRSLLSNKNTAIWPNPDHDSGKTHQVHTVYCHDPARCSPECATRSCPDGTRLCCCSRTSTTHYWPSYYHDLHHQQRGGDLLLQTSYRALATTAPTSKISKCRMTSMPLTEGGSHRNPKNNGNGVIATRA